MPEDDCALLAISATPAEQVNELRVLAERIKERDRHLKECARSHWLQNGRDLLEAKRLVPHGQFEAWCRKELSYSKSKAEKLMRAAEMFGPLLNSGTVTVLPPQAVCYLLSAPSVPQEIKDEFVPRVLAGEKVGPKLKQMIKDHRQPVEHDPAESLRANFAHIEPEPSEQYLESERQTEACQAALRLIVARIGDDLPKLLDLVANSGRGGVFSPDAERVWEELVWEIAGSKALINDGCRIDVGVQPETLDVDVVAVRGTSEAGVNTITAVELSVDAPESEGPRNPHSDLTNGPENAAPAASSEGTAAGANFANSAQAQATHTSKQIRFGKPYEVFGSRP